MNSLPAHLQPDCAACCGLCCVAPGFDAQQGFGYDKPAHEACRHLQADFRCAIHATLGSEGFPGCTSYDCHGAGQRVTREFAGRDWQMEPEQAEAQYQAFMRMRPLHGLLALLATARAHVHDDPWQQRLLAQEQAVEAHCAKTPAANDAATSRELGAATAALLAELGRTPGILGLPHVRIATDKCPPSL
jgi:hypothetical protein